MSLVNDINKLTKEIKNLTNLQFLLISNKQISKSEKNDILELIQTKNN